MVQSLWIVKIMSHFSIEIMCIAHEHIPSNFLQNSKKKITKITILPKFYGRFYIKLLFHFAYEIDFFHPYPSVNAQNNQLKNKCH